MIPASSEPEAGLIFPNLLLYHFNDMQVLRAGSTMSNKQGSRQGPAMTPVAVVSVGLSEIPEPTSLSKPKILPEAYFFCSTLRLKFLP